MATVDVLVSEAAKILNISASHVRYLERTGQLRARRAGQVRIFDRAEVEQLATERYRKATGQVLWRGGERRTRPRS
jgi:excisionase family DNA binding protein